MEVFRLEIDGQYAHMHQASSRYHFKKKQPYYTGGNIICSMYQLILYSRLKTTCIFDTVHREIFASV